MYFSKKDYIEEVLENGVKRTILARGGGLMLVKFDFQVGQMGALHNHIHEQNSYILSGKFEFEIDGKKYICVSGDSMFIPSNIFHGCVCLEEGSLLDTFTPMREDFLK